MRNPMHVCPDDQWMLRLVKFCVCLAKVIKGEDGRNRGFAFITMSTAEEAAAAVEKLNASVSVCSQPWILKCVGLRHAVVWRVIYILQCEHSLAP
jgi:RNA recognition motif-containing protein